jgi:DNA adenine methylase
VSYLGAKTGAGVFQGIIALMPPHDTYCEPFAGSAAIFARKAPCPHTILLDRHGAQVDRLRRDLAAWPDDGPCVEIHQADSLAWLEAFDPAGLGRVLFYLDPPYLASTRTSRHRYEHELTEADHIRLAAAAWRLSEAGCALIISGYPSRLYEQLFTGWNTRDFQAMTRGGVRTERVWFNFEPGAGHWATFAGRDFTERQRIKRKAARWAAKFQRLPPAERMAVLAAILADRDPA